MNDYLRCRLWLAIALTPDSRRINQLIDKYNSAQAVYDAFRGGDNLRLSGSELQSLKNVNFSQVDYLYNSCRENGIEVYAPEDEAFPKKLTVIDSPPNVLFSYGDLSLIDSAPSVAVIGAREADDYAIGVTRKLSYELASKGVTIISGFARGVDSAAHRAALTAGGRTIAVLACGIDFDYPKNTRMFKDDIAQSGAVISEYFPSAIPCKNAFKVRNRLVSGLSDGILVTQAGERSGTLNTVSHGLSQGKEIFAIPPHDIFSDSYKGNIGLLRDGATAVYSAYDILSNLSCF